jgi:hypothetical protein
VGGENVIQPETPPREDSIDIALRAIQRAIVKHPLAAQAIYSALVREGRAYGETEEGRLLRERLARSELATRLRTTWDIVTFGMLDAHARPGVVPSVLMEALVQAVFRTRFEARVRCAVEHEGIR